MKRKKVILIIGPPGIGKTITAKMLYKKMANSQFVDADELWRINPFVVNDANKCLIESNIKAVYENFLKHSTIENFILSWVVSNPNLFQIMQNWFKESVLYTVLLHANIESYKSRLINGKRDLNALSKYNLLKSNYQKMDTIQIDTSSLPVSEVVEMIITKTKNSVTD